MKRNKVKEEAAGEESTKGTGGEKKIKKVKRREIVRKGTERMLNKERD